MSQTIGATGGHARSYATHPGPNTATPGRVLTPLNMLKFPRTTNVFASITSATGA